MKTANRPCLSDLPMGSQLVAKAWTDPEFRRFFVQHPLEVLEMNAIPWEEDTSLTILENTPVCHHVIVCTLCSCYPTALLGPPPFWYKSGEYRKKIVSEPRKFLLSQFGLNVPSDVEIRVFDSTFKDRFMVLPHLPPELEGLDQIELALSVTLDSLIGTGIAGTETSWFGRPYGDEARIFGDPRLKGGLLSTD